MNLTDRGFEVGPWTVAGSSVVLVTDDSDFAAVAGWSFRDLLTDAPTADAHYEFRVTANEIGERWSMWRNGDSCGTQLEVGYVLFHLQWELNRIVLERAATTVHAACVSVDERAVVLVGSTMSGKTTLAGHLARSGGTFIADEIAAIDDGRVNPYLRPLGLRAGGPLEPHFEHPDHFDRRFDRYEMLVPVTALVGVEGIADRPVAVGAIVFPKYEPAERTSMTAMRPSVAFELLCDSSPGLERHGRPVFRQLAALVNQVPSVSMSVSTLDPTLGLIRTLIDR